MRTNFFRAPRFAAIAALFVLATACSKKGEVEASSAVDAKNGVNANASASATDTASTPPPPPASTATPAANDKTVVVTVRVNDGTGLVELKPGTTVNLPYRTSVLFDPPLKSVGVTSGPFKTQTVVDGAVILKFEPNEKELEKLEKGEKLAVSITLGGSAFNFNVGMLL